MNMHGVMSGGPISMTFPNQFQLGNPENEPGNLEFPSEGNFYATSSRGRYGNASSVTGYLKHD